MDITADTLVVDIAVHHPRRNEVFERKLQGYVHLKKSVLSARVATLDARAPARRGPAVTTR